MNIDIRHLKGAVYVMMALLGAYLLYTASCLIRTSGSTLEPEVQVLTGLGIMVAGCGSLFFGICTYILREEEDVWR